MWCAWLVVLALVCAATFAMEYQRGSPRAWLLIASACVCAVLALDNLGVF